MPPSPPLLSSSPLRATPHAGEVVDALSQQLPEPGPTCTQAPPTRVPRRSPEWQRKKGPKSVVVPIWAYMASISIHSPSKTTHKNVETNIHEQSQLRAYLLFSAVSMERSEVNRPSTCSLSEWANTPNAPKRVKIHKGSTFPGYVTMPSRNQGHLKVLHASWRTSPQLEQLHSLP